MKALASIHRILPVVICTSVLAPASTRATETAIVQTGTVAAAEAGQAAAADDQFYYAIDNMVIAKYSRATGERLALSTGPAYHLNSGFVWEGRLYCAHSNYPRKPEQSKVMVLSPEPMEISAFRDFGQTRGSLTWVVREGAHWWCNFAHYGDEKAKTTLVKFDDSWNEAGAWTYPEAVLNDLGAYSISGGIWHEGSILATGHDRKVVYRLRLPKDGTVLELLEVIPSPFPGQGIAIDPKTGGILGIDRARRQIVFGRLAQGK